MKARELIKHLNYPVSDLRQILANSKEAATMLERFIALADELEGEALTKARTDEGYCINGAYQFCAKRIREILEET